MDPALAIPEGSCPHLAMLLARREEVAPALASFYALGVKRNGWLFHRSLAGHADADRAELTAAGLDVVRLEAEGRMAFGEIDLGISVDDYVHGWEPQMEAALARGFDAAWWARFPLADPALIDRSVPYDAAWDAHFHGKPCVSLCLFIVGDVERDRRLEQIAATHDTVLT